jgi:quercetin dioxygenase-like cupin family protein/type 1 glutamine amidotransferase
MTLFAQPASPAAGPNLGAVTQKSPPLAKKIVIIGGKKSHGPGEHDFPNGVPMIAAWLKASPAFAAVDVLSYTGGFPADLAVLDGASSLVLYFDGVQETPPPLLDPARVAKLQQLMDAGAGLITLHQASTLPAGNKTVPLTEWLGAQRNGMFDRTTEKVTLKLATASHPVTAGVKEIAFEDEFYPTLQFHPQRKVTPILRTELTPKFGDAKKQQDNPPARGEHTVGWAFERANGGRSFGFTGAHYVKNLENPNLRQLLVNAIAWTAKIDVPAGGVPVPGPIVGISQVNRHAENRVVPMPWGHLRWYTSAEMGNSRTMTTGVAVIKPGQTNPRHFHPNCDEILHVISGKIRHTMNEVSVEMNAGDTVSIPQGVLHNAANIGTEDAVLAISFSTAYREAVGYDTK